jgi:biopolymer transport protein ExbB
MTSFAPLFAQAAAADPGTYFDRYVLDGGIMMFFLVPASALALGMILQNFLNLRRGRLIGGRRFREAREELARSGNREALAELLQRRRSVALARVALRGLAAERIPTREEAVYLIREEVARLFRSVNPLAVIFNLAPYLGILGTVLGLMDSFEAYAARRVDLDQLGAGLKVALLTTVWGLGIAIPSHLFYHLFRGRLIRAEEDLLPEEVERLFQPLREKSKAPSPYLLKDESA